MKHSFYAQTGIPGRLAGLALAAAVLATSCQRSGGGGKPADVDYYTCTMHPSVRSQSPRDKCPICSMDLVPVKKKGTSSPSPSGSEAGDSADQTGKARITNEATQASAESASPNQDRTEPPGEFSVPVQRQQQIGVTYAAIERRPFTRAIRAVGTVANDRSRHWDYVSRVEGYVKKLFVFSRGELVDKGAPILTIYSPDLLTTQNELLDAVKMRDEARARNQPAVLESAERLVESARRRLRLWNVGDEEVAALERTRKAHEELTLYSPFKGVVQDLGVDQGRRVAPGDRLVDIADLSVVWVWAQFYQDELPLLKKGSPVAIIASPYPSEKFNGTISVLDPFIDDALRTGRVRIDVENADLKLRPELYVDVELNVAMGEGLAVPVGAVLATGQHNVVFVDKGEGRLEPRFVELGRKYGDYYEVASGLSEAERVVTSANFLIDAEAKVQGALKSW